MGVIVFDIRDAERRLKEAGMAEKLAATQAEIMAESFIHHADQLATRDDLDRGLSDLAERMETRMDKRFATIDAKMLVIAWILAVNTAAVLVPLVSSLV